MIYGGLPQVAYDMTSEENQMNRKDKNKGVTRYTIADYVSEIQNPEWEKLAETFSPFYPVDESESEGIIEYSIGQVVGLF